MDLRKAQDMIEISSISKIYIKVLVTALKSGVADDPTGDVVQFAFMTQEPDPGDPTSTPAGGDWVSGSWETSRRGYFARCLVGPGGAKQLTPSETPYWVWVWVTDSPEQPKEPVGAVKVH